MQLLRIEQIPIQYKMQIEHGRLEVNPAEIPKRQVQRTPLKANIHTERIQVQLDTTEMRRSMGLRNISDVLREQASRGMQAAQEATADMSRFGTQIGQNQDGVTIPQLITQRLMQQPETITTFLPSVGPSISWVPPVTDIQIEPGVMETNWQIDQNVLSYVPGKFHLIIDQYPKVNIEYLGKPMYVPASSAPDYQGESA